MRDGPALQMRGRLAAQLRARGACNVVGALMLRPNRSSPSRGTVARDAKLAATQLRKTAPPEPAQQASAAHGSPAQRASAAYGPPAPRARPDAAPSRNCRYASAPTKATRVPETAA